jgi:hypothetical protein
MAFSAAAMAPLGVRLARDDFASNGRGPFPQVAADAVHQRVFDLSIFHCHGTEAICAAGTVWPLGITPLFFSNDMLEIVPRDRINHSRYQFIWF